VCLLRRPNKSIRFIVATASAVNVSKSFLCTTGDGVTELDHQDERKCGRRPMLKVVYERPELIYVVCENVKS